MEDISVNGQTENQETNTNPLQENEERKRSVKIFLRPVGGNTQKLSQQKFLLDDKKCLFHVRAFLLKQLRLGNNDMLFMYCGNGFAPAPDHSIAELYRDFRTGNELYISYGVLEAWG